MALIYQNGPAALIAVLLADLQFGQIIKQMVRFDERQCYLNPGKRLKTQMIKAFLTHELIGQTLYIRKERGAVTSNTTANGDYSYSRIG